MTGRWRMRALSLVAVMVPTLAATADAPALKVIMQELRDNATEIADGLLNEDYEQIVRGASSIAEHPKIAPAEIALVAAALGAEMPEFKRLDGVVHDLSLAIRAAAEARNRDAVMSGYQQLIEGCVDCHSAYKARVAAVLGAKPE